MNRKQFRGVALAALMVLSVVSFAGTASAAGDTTMSLDPSSQSVNAGQTVTYDIVLDNAQGGVGSADLNVSVNDTSVAEITNVSVNSGFPSTFTSTSVANDGSMASVQVAGGDTADTGSVTVATIELTTSTNGSVGLDLAVTSAGDEAGNSYNVTGVNDGTLDVTTASGGGGGGTTPAASLAEPSVIGVTEYNGDFTVAFDRPVANASTGAAIENTDQHFILFARQAGSGEVVRVNVSAADVTALSNGARYEIAESAHGLGDISPAGEVDVYISNTRPASVSNDTYDTTPGNVTADISSEVIFESGTDHTDRDTAQRIYQGSPVSFQAASDDANVLLENIETGEIILDGSTGANSQEIVFESDGLESGTTYRLTFNENSAGEVQKYFNVTSLRMSASIDEDGNLFEHNEEAEISVSGSSIRGNSDVAIDVVGESDRYELTNFDNRAEFDETYNYGLSLDAGDYEVVVTDVDTGVSVTAGEFSVDTFPEASSASFGGGVFEEERGDVVEIPINLADSEEGAQATVAIGSKSETNYVTNVTVADEDGDGEVVLEWNTYMSGTNISERIFTAQGADNVTAFGGENGSYVEDLHQAAADSGRFGFTDPANADSQNIDYSTVATIDAASYDLAVVANNEDDNLLDYQFNLTNKDEGDVGAVSINTRSTESSQVWVVPSDKADQVDLDFIDENTDNTEDDIDGNLTQSDMAAEGELIVHQVSASGLEGIIRNRTDAGANETVAFLSEESGYVSQKGLSNTLPAFDAGFEEEESSVDPNRDARRFDLDKSNTEVLADYQNDTYYIVVKLGGVDESKLVNDDAWNASFGFESYDAIGPVLGGPGGGTVYSTWSYVDAEATLDTDAQDRVVIRNQAGQTIRGDTNVAPGTKLGLRINSQSDTSPFLTTLNTHVSEDRSFAATGDFSNRGAGINFTVRVRRGGEAISDTYDGRIKAQPSASVTLSDQEVTETNQEVVVDSATLSDGGFIAIHEGSASGDVIGTSKYLEAGQHSNVRVDLDSAVSDGTTLVAMPHLDDNSNNLYDFPEADAPYTADGAAVTDDASISVGEDTPEPTPTPTDEPTPTPTDEPTPTPTDEPTPTPTDEPTAMPTDEPTDEPTPEPTTTSDGGPGFGVAVSLIALLAAALLTARRRD